MIFGKISEEMPLHTLIESSQAFSVRRYQPALAAVCTYSKGWGQGSDGEPFRQLAKYIGVFSKPHNVKAMLRDKSDAMAPTDVSDPDMKPEPIAMTAPVVIDASSSSFAKHEMMFILPASKYKHISEVPRPINPNIKIIELPERTYAVRQFNGNMNYSAAKENLQLLLDDLSKDPRWSLQTLDDGNVDWKAAGYNPPFTIPRLKTNEVMVAVMGPNNFDDDASHQQLQS